MIHREEEQYPEPRISQEEEPPSLLKQVIIGLAFVGFIILAPTVIMKQK